MNPDFEMPDDRVAFDIAPVSARIIARAIDIGIILAIAILISVALVITGVIDQDHLENPTSDSNADTAVSLAIFSAAFLYEVSLLATRGKTLGKVVTRSKVISTSHDGPPTLGAAIMRVAVWVLPSLLLPTIGLLLTLGVFAWVLFDSNRQGLHDKIASTYVVMDHPVLSGDPPPGSG